MTRYEPIDPSFCKQCDSWMECPCCCGWGWCAEDECFTEEMDSCPPEDRWGRL